MCGLNGIFHLHPLKKVDENVLTKMRDALEHRGPDDKGLFIDQNIGFGHRRLSILDTSAAGHQPFHSDDGRYSMVYNGEIYNFKSFYPELKANGFEIKTSSDTEVLLKLFEWHGLAILPRLNGMFAIAIWDKLCKKLILIRDRMGVKPLYYSKYNDSLYFASEQKALFVAGVPLKIAQEGLEEYVFNRFVAGENTLYQNVNKVLPGHIMTFEEGGKTTVERWWHLKSEIENHDRIKNPEEWFKNTFDDAVKLRMVSDVPVGVMLSGGLDSSSIAASLKDQGFNGIQTFNIGFNEKEHNESDLAQSFATQLNYSFESKTLEGQNLFDKMIQSTYFQDEPLMHLSEPHLLTVAQMAKPKVKVLLSGEGADELMGGYVRYKALQFPAILQSINAIGSFDVFSKNLRYDKLARYSKIERRSELILYNGSNIYPNDIAEHYGINKQPNNQYRIQIYKEAKVLYPNNLRRQALYFDQHTYLCSLLDRNDRCTMGASIECREPFLDPRLVVGLGTLDDKWLFTGKKWKYILKKSMQNRLPNTILDFKKIGLSAPWGDYLIKNPAFKDEMQAFSKSELFQMPYFENINISKLIHQLEIGNNTMTPFIMPLFMMHIWLKTYTSKF